PSDTSRAAFSVAAQPSIQNYITVDGMTFLFGDVPRDAIVSNELILNAYDVSHGQFTGGQLVATTRSGTEHFEGSSTFIANPRGTQFAGVGRDAFAQTYSQQILSARVSGPIGTAHRAFYSVSGEAQNRDAPILALSSASPGVLAK